MLHSFTHTISFVHLLAIHLSDFHDKDDMVNLLLLRPWSAVATVLLSCLVVSSFVVLSTESVRARPIAATAKDPRVLSSLSPSSEDQPSLIERGITTTPLTRPASLPDSQDQENEEGLLQLQLQRQQYQQQQQRQNQNQLYDIQPVFVVDQTEFDVYMGIYPDKRPRPHNASAKRRKKKNKKKKKKPVLDEQGQVVIQQEVVVEPVQVQGRQYLGPVYEQKSLPGFHMAAVEAPWRYQMSYTLDWKVDENLRERIEEGLTTAEARRQDQMWRYETAKTQPGATVSDEGFTGPVVEKQRLRVGSELVMDFQLIPLDQVKSNELLLTRVPVSSLQAHIQLRPEVLEGWYRLQVQFWEEPVPSSPDCDLFASSSDDYGEDNGYDKDGKDRDWGEASDSVLLSSPGRLKEDIWTNNCFPRQVGIWRSAEAIEVTNLGARDLEWEEFIETLSRETRQERWSLAEFSSSKSSERTSWGQQKAILREEHLAIEEFREPKPVVVNGSGDSGGRWGWGLGFGRLSEIRHRIKGFLAHPLWGSSDSNKAATATEQETPSSTASAGLSPVMSSSSSSAPPIPPVPPLRRRQDKRIYERTVFPQDSFRYQEFVGPNIKDVIPDFLVQELEEFEDAEMDALEARQGRLEQRKKQLKEAGKNDEDVVVEEEDVAIYPMSEWDPEIARLQELMDVWNSGALLKKRDGDVDGDSMQQEIEEVVADQDDEEEDEKENEQELILEVERGVQARNGLNPRIWQGAIETDSQAPVTWRSNRDRIISWRIPQQSSHQATFLLDIELTATPIDPKEQKTTWTREMIAQAALDQQPAVALLTDRVPVTWGSVQVTLPAWVPTGTYHVRIQGVSEVGGGVVVGDVSQPFVVLSDPYLYSYS
ncbi:hypothetical protein KI688_007439 [Linnemannia hyalina]|uniref:Uncharacterized protein n=1 Tax=Linnemannia hyalina TaxID=64524 RepID=A0A9P8BMU5_9FUNG|nr:hypothetical protein KI688_007439 [Linnemannia hyalina]